MLTDVVVKQAGVRFGTKGRNGSDSKNIGKPIRYEIKDASRPGLRLAGS